ncbi:hypothetical protein [Candidatus Harpocratesius sp.]
MVAQQKRRRKTREIVKDLHKLENEVDEFFSSNKNPVYPNSSLNDRKNNKNNNNNDNYNSKTQVCKDDDYNSISPEEKAKLEKILPLPMKIARRWQDFILNTEKTLQQIEDEFRQNHLKRLERLRKQKKVAQQRRLERIKRREERLEAKFQQELQEFEAANEKLNENFIAMKSALYQKKAEKRDKFHSNLNQAQNRWERVSRKRQRNIEKILKGINRWGWRQQLRIVLILIPLIVVLILVIVLLRPFLTVI